MYIHTYINLNKKILFFC